MSGYALQFIGAGFLATFNTKTPYWEHYFAILPAGVGFGGIITLLLIALISSVPIEGFPLLQKQYLTILDQASATGMSYLFRSTGSVVGITVTQCVLQNLLKIWLTERIHGPNAEYIITKVRESATTIYDPNIVPIEFREIIVETYVEALRVTFLIVIGFIVLNTISGAFLQEHVLHDNIERRAEAAQTEEGEA